MPVFSLPLFLSKGAERRLPASLSVAGYPDASNMPSVSGSTLTYYPNYPNSLTSATATLSASGDVTASTPGQIVENLDITGTVIVQAAGVIVRKCRIRCGGSAIWGVYVEEAGGYSATIEDCLIDGQGATAGNNAVAEANYTIRRCNILGVENGFDLNQTADIRHCFIHDLYQGGAAHTDGLQASNGSNTTIQHCTFFADTAGVGGTSAININNSAGGPTTSNVLIDDNVLAGGAYTLYCPIPATVNFRVTNNKFWAKDNPQSGSFGYEADVTDETFTGNQLGTFSGGLVGNVITGTWSGAPVP